MTEHDTHDTIRADRACIACGFNLFGQPITRESHYNLLITRCPECGQAAALQSYPTMSHWVNRFRAILSALWIALTLGILALTVLINTGITQGACENASQELATTIAADHQAWLEMSQQNTSTTTPSAPNLPNFVTRSFSRWSIVTPEWRELHLDETIANAGGLNASIDPEYLILLIPAVILSAIFGVFWSLALLNAARWRAAALCIAIAATTLAFTLTFNHVGAGTQMAQSIAKSHLTPIVAPRVVLIQAITMVLAVYIARPLARLYVCAALPPRSRTALSFLWTADKKPLPKSGRGR